MLYLISALYQILKEILKYIHTFSHLADTFIQSDLQMRTLEAI